jgi:hypothetical protein
MFRRIFARRGPPERVRVDNGYPWGTPRDLPSELALWLIGSGVEPIWNPPARPTCNPQVERSNGLTQQRGELQTCTGWRPAARRLDWACRIQREEDPAIRGRPRIEAFPALLAPRRAYRPAREPAMWDLSRVDAFLARGCGMRRADCNGKISIYGQGRSGGRARAGREMAVPFDAAARCWSVSDPNGAEVKRLPAEELTRKRIMAFAVSRRR